jgi:hypothetical protein
VRGQAENQAIEARRAADDYQRITATFPVTQTSTENLRATVVEFTRIASRTCLARERIRTRLPGPGPVSAVRARPDRLQRRPADRRDRSAALTQPNTPGSRADPQGESAARLEISGRVNATERNDYRAITAQVRRFAGALGSSGYELARTDLPFDVAPEGTLTGDIGSTESGEAPRFTIVLLRRLP